MTVLRILVADDHALLRAAVKDVLDATPGFELVGEAVNGAQVLPLVGQAKPDVVLLDLKMPQLDGLGVLDRLRERYPNVITIVLSATDDPAVIDQAFRRGAAGFIFKSINPVDLPAAIRQAVDGDFLTAPSKLLHRTKNPAEAAGLSEREAMILEELARGRSNREIARTLFLSEQTVKFHLRNIYRKLGVANRTEAARFAFERGLVESTA